MRAQANPPIVLDWRSSLAVLSASGALGMSNGPWLATGQAEPAAAAGPGQVVSGWQRQALGPWKYVIDNVIARCKAATGGNEGGSDWSRLAGAAQVQRQGFL